MTADGVDFTGPDTGPGHSGLPDPLPIRPLLSAPDVRVTIPGSKSLTNRALLVAALADGLTTVEGALFADDPRHFAASLVRLGFQVDTDPDVRKVAVTGRGGIIPRDSAELFTGNAGTAARFLTALCGLGDGPYVIDGSPRMRQRPIGPLLDGLEQLGARVRSLNGNGCPPVEVNGPLTGGVAAVDPSLSSQYLTALLLIGPYMAAGLDLRLKHPSPARPYIEMTIRMMAERGVAVSGSLDDRRLVVSPGAYRSGRLAVEPDASSAGYFWAAAALTGGTVTVNGIHRGALQGDAAFVDVLQAMGCRVTDRPEGLTVTGPPDRRLHAIDVDLNAMSDMTPTLAAMAPFCTGVTRIRNVGHIRVQETDRLAAVSAELRRLGVRVAEGESDLTIWPGPVSPAVIQTYDDHRMAMAFSLVGLRAEGIAIADPGCVSKTFPEYFSVLGTLAAGPS